MDRTSRVSAAKEHGCAEQAKAHGEDRTIEAHGEGHSLTQRQRTTCSERLAQHASAVRDMKSTAFGRQHAHAWGETYRTDVAT